MFSHVSLFLPFFSQQYYNAETVTIVKKYFQLSVLLSLLHTEKHT